MVAPFVLTRLPSVAQVVVDLAVAEAAAVEDTAAAVVVEAMEVVVMAGEQTHPIF